MMTSPSVSVGRRLSMMSFFQAAKALLTGQPANAASPTVTPQDRRRQSRWTNHTQRQRNAAKVKARRQMQKQSRRRNRAA